MAHWLDDLPLPCCLSSRAFPSRTCFKLLNSRSRAIELCYSFSNGYQSTSATITRNCQARYLSRLSSNSRLKSLENFVQGHRFILLKSILGASDLQSLSKLFLPCWAFLFFLFSLKLLIKTLLLFPNLSAI